MFFARASWRFMYTSLAKFAQTDGEKSDAERILKYLDKRTSEVAAAPPVSERPALRPVLQCAGDRCRTYLADSIVSSALY
jgi:hypothetical protein